MTERGVESGQPVKNKNKQKQGEMCEHSKWVKLTERGVESATAYQKTKQCERCEHSEWVNMTERGVESGQPVKNKNKQKQGEIHV